MNPFTCSRLNEVRAALTQGHWPQASPADLRAHVEACPRCTQEVLLTTHLQQARAATLPATPPAAASLLWWRAQVRRRNAALERAGRPLAAAQIFALVLAVAVVVGILATHWHTLVDRTPSVQSAALALTTLRGDWGLAPLIAAIAILTTLSGIVLYLSINRQ